MPQMWLLSFHPRTNIHVIIIIIFVIMTDSDLNQYKQIGTRPGDRCDMRLSRIYITKRSIFTDEMYSTCRKGRWSFWSWFYVNRSTFDENVRKNDFYNFVPSDIDLWPLYHKFARLVTIVQRYVSTKLEVSKTFLFRENRRHGTDGQGVTLNAASA